MSSGDPTSAPVRNLDMPKHHPSDGLLTDYASGALRPAFGVVVAAHLEACPRCRMTVSTLETLGGELMAELPSAALSAEAVSRVMAGIERPLPPAQVLYPTEKRIPFGPERWLGPGMGIRKASLEGGGLLYRLRLPAGQETFHHGHRGAEYTAVLKGAFNDGLHTYGEGDFAESDPDLEHLPHVSPDGECICLIASEKPMKIRAWMGRFFQIVAGV